MKPIKMLTLTAIVAAALMALVGAGTSSATVLCENSQTTTCTAQVGSGSTQKFSAEESIKLTGPFSLLIYTCNSSTLEGLTTSTGGGSGVPVTAEVTGFSLEGCSRPTTVGAKGTLSFKSIGGTDNGTVTSTGLTITIHEIPGFGTCSFSTSSTTLGTLTGSLTTPTIDLAATLPAETSGCPSGALSGKYKYTGTTPFIVSAS